MALHYNHTQIPEDKRVYEFEGETHMHPTLYALTFYTIPIGLPTLTEENVDEWMARLAIYERVFDCLRTKNVDGKCVDAPMTRQDLLDYIGLVTNANKYTRNQFMKNVWARLDSELARAKKKEETNVVHATSNHE